MGSALPELTAAAFIFDGAGRVLLIHENYARRRYGPPGGVVAPGESPRQAVVREVHEETCIEARVRHLVGVYFFRRGERCWLAFAFRCDIAAGAPAVPPTGEIADVGWFDRERLPEPVTNLTRHALPDAASGARGVVRDIALA